MPTTQIGNNVTPGVDDWVGPIISRCQRLAGELIALDDEDARGRIEGLASSIASPPTRAHNLVLASLLLDTAFRISDHMHRRVPQDTTCRCRHVNVTTIRTFLNWREQNAAQVFRRWVDEFLVTFDRAHPQTPADRLARLLRQNPVQPWTLRSLAKAVSLPAHGLARMFRRQYGMTVRDYLHLCRMDAMLARWSADTKIEALALDVGYRSRKDFYRVLRQTLQTTPAMLRRLSPAERKQRQRRLRERLLVAAEHER